MSGISAPPIGTPPLISHTHRGNGAGELEASDNEQVSTLVISVVRVTRIVVLLTVSKYVRHQAFQHTN